MYLHAPGKQAELLNKRIPFWLELPWFAARPGMELSHQIALENMVWKFTQVTQSPAILGGGSSWMCSVQTKGASSLEKVVTKLCEQLADCVLKADMPPGW
ncbi:hypothetical protein AV530_014783 [Patagioenas fasciata monilis]|uniref:Uncharacterized protein n=1 Tax=Patagioenas fasciata monilis TaxID=372326 RepID=A0A1V4L0F1_PATFA|nr:hypothetical protein AV530_014783 [Patagioenas fasciata monilis]